jgi:hypothetical protein
MDVCTNCHARLDYGMQFFRGYPSSVDGIDFRPDNALSGTGPLYGQHIGDPRGVDELSPRGFARLLVSQPEFGECMARKVTDHVFGIQATPDDHDAVLLAFQDEHTFKAMMRTALQRLVSSRQQEALPLRDAAPPPQAEPSSAELAEASEPLPPGQVELPPELARAINNHCAHCHDGIDQLDLSTPSLDRHRLIQMADHVAFGLMPPRPNNFDDQDRTRFLEQVVHAIWSEPEARTEALAFFQTGQRAHAVHGFQGASTVVAAEAGADQPMALRNLQQIVGPAERVYSPGMAAELGIIGLRACQDQWLQGDALEACVRQATAPSMVIRDPVQ